MRCGLAERNPAEHLREVLAPREKGHCAAIGRYVVATVRIRLKVAATDEIGSIVGSALPGVPLAHMPQVPPAIPVRPNTYYFSLSTKTTLYERALAAGALAIYAPDGIPGLKIELIAIN